MKLLLTSDWQADIGNLAECEIALKELIAYAKQYQVDAIIHCGDTKERYDNIALRVTKFWVRAVRQIKAAGFRLIILLGNHDRLAMGWQARNWLDILRSAGAETVTKPRWKQINNGWVAFLPYTPDKKLELRWADELAKDSLRIGGKLLIAHTEIAGMALTLNMECEGISPRQLHTDKYDAVFSGHIHKRQNNGKIWYVGNPFVQSWGEVNDRKGYILVDV